MDIKVYLKNNDNTFRTVTHRDVINYSFTAERRLGGKQTLTMTLKDGTNQEVNLEYADKVLIIKPYCVWRKETGLTNNNKPNVKTS